MAELLTCPHGHQWVACPVCNRGAATVSLRPEPAVATQELTGPELARRPLARAAKVLPEVAGYEILGVLGRGGMGVVYKARQKSLNRVVALKMIRAGAHADAIELARFRAEAEAAARLQHPNMVQVYEVGAHDGQPYFSLEFVAGGSLKEKLDRTPQPPRTAAELTETLALAIQYAHERGIIHRDLKPANILLTAEDAELRGSAVVRFVPKITDFGLAKQLDVDAGQTHSGTILGTPSYMAPEQAAGNVREIGPAADVYALGVMLYEMLTGRPPFHAANMLDTLEQVRTLEPLPPRRLQPKVPRDLETICLKCLQKQPRQRYHSAGALADDLRRFLEGQPISARPTPLWERGLKWVARRPAISGLGLLAIAVTLSGFGLVMEQRYEAERRGDDAVRAEAGFQESRASARRAQEAFEQETRTAQDETREAEIARLNVAAKQYFNNVSLADQAFWNSLPTRAEELLDRCPPLHCQWEWYYLKRLCHDALLVVPGVDTVACSPDGMLLASAAHGGRSRSGTRPPAGSFTASTTTRMRHRSASPSIPTAAVSPPAMTMARFGSGKLPPRKSWQLRMVTAAESRTCRSVPTAGFSPRRATTPRCASGRGAPASCCTSGGATAGQSWAWPSARAASWPPAASTPPFAFGTRRPARRSRR